MGSSLWHPVSVNPNTRNYSSHDCDFSNFIGFTPDVKVWEVIFGKNGEYQEVKTAFSLTGHTSGVYDVAFDSITSHMATVSKDGTWKLFDVNGKFITNFYNR